MRALVVGCCLAWAACAPAGDGALHLTLEYADNVSDDRLAAIVTLEFTVDGDEMGTYAIATGRAAQRTERLLYRPLATSRAISLLVEAFDANHDIVASGSSPALAVGPGEHATTITLTGGPPPDLGADGILAEDGGAKAGLAIVSDPRSVDLVTCSPAIAFEIHDVKGVPIAQPAPRPIALTFGPSTMTPRIFDDSQCTHAVSKVAIATGATQALAYVMGNTSGAFTLTASTGASADAVQEVVVFHYQHLILADTPVAYWRLDEAAGPTMKDASPGAFDGTYTATGVVYQLEGAVLSDPDAATAFDGAAGYGLVPHDTRLSPAKVTAEAWFYPTSTAVAFTRIVDKGGDCAGGGYDLEFNPMGMPGHVRWVVWSGYNPLALDSDAAVPLNVWTHVAGTFDGTTMKMYVNGVLQTATLTATMTANTDGLAIGVRTGAACQRNDFFTGKIDEVAVYDRVLDANTLLRHYNAAGR